MPPSPNSNLNPQSGPSSNGARLLLVAMMVLSATILWRSDRFHARVVPDTASYLDVPLNSLAGALSHYRTPGYPVFLAATKPFAAEWAAVPIVHYLIFCGAVAALFRSLGPLAGPWARAFIAGSLLFANILIGPESTVETVATDFLASAFGVLAVSLLLLRATRAVPSRWLLLAIALVSAAAWIVRPAYLFLVPMIPLLGAMLTKANSHITNRTGGLREPITLGFVTLLPLVAWCGLRQTVVGRFGAVSFGGYNLIGIAGQFLDDGLAQELPDDLQPLALAALERQKTFSFPGPTDAESSKLNYERIERRYDDTIWRIYLPAAEELAGNAPVRVNSDLKRLAFEIIKRRPRDYVIWVAKATRQAVRKLVSDFVLNPVYLALLFATIGTQLLCILRHSPAPDATCPGATASLFVVAMVYATASLSVVIIVCPPLGRMTDAAGLFMAPAITSVFCGRLCCLRR